METNVSESNKKLITGLYIIFPGGDNFKVEEPSGEFKKYEW